MKKFYRLFWFGTIILMLATAACAPSQDTTPTAFETFSAGPTAAMSKTPFATETASTAETTTGLAGTASPSGTLDGTGTASTSGTAVTSPTSETLTPAIPVTGFDVNVLDCQFCVNDMAHALLIMPDTASFKVTTSLSSDAQGLTCTTIEVSNGKQVVLCSGPQSKAVTLNVCSNTGTCSDIPIKLIDCPLSSSGTAVPNKTQTAVTTSPTAAGTATPSGSLPTATITPTP